MHRSGGVQWNQGAVNAGCVEKLNSEPRVGKVAVKIKEGQTQNVPFQTYTSGKVMTD